MFEDLVKARYNGLSAGQKKVAEYMLQNLEKCSYDTIAKIGRDTNVSETTVIRLSYALGFGSFSEMQRTIRSEILESSNGIGIAEETSPEEHENPYAQIIEHDLKILKQTLAQLEPEQLDLAVELLMQADHVMVAGYRTSYAAASWLSMTLGYLRGGVRLVELNGDVFEHLLTVTDRTVVVAVSFPRYAKETHRFAHAAKKMGAKLVSVTDSKLSPVGCMSDISLVTRSNRDETGFNSMAAAISVLNLLVVGVRRKNQELCGSRLQKLEELYSQYDILFE
jgi:DNA-binding MurR/RpiR family transcriptional regulator